MKFSPIFISTIASLALFNCSENNPNHILNPESSLYDATLAADANGNGIADGIEPYLAECNQDAKCAADKAYAHKIATMPSSSVDMSSANTNSSSSDAQTNSSSSINPGNSSSSVNPNATQVTITVSGGFIKSTGLNSGLFAVGTSLEIIADTNTVGLDQCLGAWTADKGVSVISNGVNATLTVPNANAQVQLNTTECPNTFTDFRDGNTYSYAIIDYRIWLTQNAKFDTPSDDFCYNNESANCVTHGKLYRYSQINSVCPVGFRIPTATEMKPLAEQLSLQSSGRGDQYDPPGFNYLGEATRKSYWVSAKNTDAQFAKNCDSNNGETCGFILTNEKTEWQIASDSPAKSYPIRCIQK